LHKNEDHVSFLDNLKGAAEEKTVFEAALRGGSIGQMWQWRHFKNGVAARAAPTIKLY
jgi:hypothetical protein